MSNTKNKDYEYLETSEEESKRGLKRITRPAFLGEPKKNKKAITIMLDPDIIEYFKKQVGRHDDGLSNFNQSNSARKIDGSQTAEKGDEIIEKLLQDKKALKKLKAELETI